MEGREGDGTGRRFERRKGKGTGRRLGRRKGKGSGRRLERAGDDDGQSRGTVVAPYPENKTEIEK
jgi:hypothetical protein